MVEFLENLIVTALKLFKLTQFALSNQSTYYNFLVFMVHCDIDIFPVNVGLRQGCVMSPWLFNVYVWFER